MSYSPPPSKRTRGAIDESGWIFNSAEFLGQAESLDDKLREIKQRRAERGKGGYAARGSANTQGRLKFRCRLRQTDLQAAGAAALSPAFIWLCLFKVKVWMELCLIVRFIIDRRSASIIYRVLKPADLSFSGEPGSIPDMDIPDGWSRATLPSTGRSVSIRCYTVLQGSGNGAEVPQIQIWSDVGPRRPDTDPRGPEGGSDVEGIWDLVLLFRT